MSEKSLIQNYDAIDQILNDSKETLIEFKDAAKEIEEMHTICIPILKAFSKPEIEPCPKGKGGYRIKRWREVNFDPKNNFFREFLKEENIPTIQKWLDQYSPTKLKVENINRCYLINISISVALA